MTTSAPRPLLSLRTAICRSCEFGSTTLIGSQRSRLGAASCQRLADDDLASTAGFGELGMHHTDWASAHDQHDLTRSNGQRVLAPDDAGKGLQQGRHSGVYTLGNRDHVALLH